MRRQLAEAAYQAKIERVLDEVRYPVAAMGSSEDLLKVAAALYHALEKLEIRFDCVGIQAFDEENGLVQGYTFHIDSAGQPVFIKNENPSQIDATLSSLYAHWKRGEVYLRCLTREEYIGRTGVNENALRHHCEFLGLDVSGDDEGEMRTRLQKYADQMYDEGRALWIVDVPFAQGTLAMNRESSTPFSEREVDFLGRLMQVFAPAYSRFLDFHALEEQVERAEQARREADQANRAKSQFLANMSHEIRTPMNAVLGYAQILQRDASLSADQHESVNAIARSGDHLLGLINDVLDLSKIEAGHKELRAVDFDLQHFLSGLATMFELRCHQQGLIWRMEGETTRPQVHGDEGKLRQVLINLLGNAVKFTDAGWIGLNLEERGDDRYRFEVGDSGPGIAPEYQQSIFEPLEQGAAGATKGGTGLGLAIAASFVEMMGGRIELESALGQGARFSFELVLPQGEVSQAASAAMDFARVRHLAPRQQVRALVVDDVEENRAVLERMLTTIGVEVELAVGGWEAIEAVRRQMPHVIFMDIRMPGMSGIEALRRIEAEFGGATCKIVGVSASALAHQRQEYLAAGFADYIDKPYRAARIYAVLADLLGVVFEYEEGDAEERTVDEVFDFATVVLPEVLYANLVKATARHNLSQLDRELAALEELGTSERRLAKYLRELAREFNMKTISQVLDQIDHV
jgi:signal transduction histidine kinase/CheY-like chemotaxis protein